MSAVNVDTFFGTGVLLKLTILICLEYWDICLGQKIPANVKSEKGGDPKKYKRCQERLRNIYRVNLTGKNPLKDRKAKIHQFLIDWDEKENGKLEKLTPEQEKEYKRWVIKTYALSANPNVDTITNDASSSSSTKKSKQSKTNRTGEFASSMDISVLVPIAIEIAEHLKRIADHLVGKEQTNRAKKVTKSASSMLQSQVLSVGEMKEPPLKKRKGSKDEKEVDDDDVVMLDVREGKEAKEEDDEDDKTSTDEDEEEEEEEEEEREEEKQENDKKEEKDAKEDEKEEATETQEEKGSKNALASQVEAKIEENKKKDAAKGRGKGRTKAKKAAKKRRRSS